MIGVKKSLAARRAFSLIQNEKAPIWFSGIKKNFDFWHQVEDVSVLVEYAGTQKLIKTYIFNMGGIDVNKVYETIWNKEYINLSSFEGKEILIHFAIKKANMIPLKKLDFVMLNEVKHPHDNVETLRLPELCSGTQGDISFLQRSQIYNF